MRCKPSGEVAEQQSDQRKYLIFEKIPLLTPHEGLLSLHLFQLPSLKVCMHTPRV